MNEEQNVGHKRDVQFWIFGVKYCEIYWKIKQCTKSSYTGPKYKKPRSPGQFQPFNDPYNRKILQALDLSFREEYKITELIVR